MNKYLKFCKKCMDGKIELSKNYYVLDSDDDHAKYKNKDSIDVSIVSPTQAAVDQAKSEVRDKMIINRGKAIKKYQIGGKDRLNNTSRKKKKRLLIKKEKLKKNCQLQSPRRKQKKKIKKKLTSYRSIWM